MCMRKYAHAHYQFPLIYFDCWCCSDLGFLFKHIWPCGVVVLVVSKPLNQCHIMFTPCYFSIDWLHLILVIVNDHGAFLGFSQALGAFHCRYGFILLLLSTVADSLLVGKERIRLNTGMNKCANAQICNKHSYACPITQGRYFVSTWVFGWGSGWSYGWIVRRAWAWVWILWYMLTKGRVTD